jgi:hypothetical protein
MSPSSRAAAQIVTTEFLRLRHQTLMEYINRPESEQPDGWKDAGLVMTTMLDITPEQMAALKQELTAVVDAAVERYRGQESLPGTRRVSLRAEVFDLPAASSRGTVNQE